MTTSEVLSFRQNGGADNGIPQRERVNSMGTDSRLSVLSAADSPARTYQWPVSVRALTEQEAASGLSSIASCPSCGLPFASLRMFPAFYPRMEDATSESSSPDWANSGLLSDGQYWTARATESRSAAAASTLSAVLQEQVCEGGDWHSQARREARKDVAGTIKGSARGSGTDNSAESAANLVLAHSPRAQEQLAHREDVDIYVTDTANALSAHPGGFRFADPTLENYIAHSLRADGFDASEDGTGRGTPLVYPTLSAHEGGRLTQIPPVLQAASVRRLTPVECERLQGFPDGWTDIDGAKDGPRYKALGNAVTVPVIEYIGKRILEILS